MKGTWAAWGLSWPCSLAMVATSSARHCADAPGWDRKKPRQLRSTGTHGQGVEWRRPSSASDALAYSHRSPSGGEGSCSMGQASACMGANTAIRLSGKSQS